MGFIYILIVGMIYFAPALVAFNRKHNNRAAILMLNLLLGWTMIGWIVAIVWASTDNRVK